MPRVAALAHGALLRRAPLAALLALAACAGAPRPPAPRERASPQAMPAKAAPPSSRFLHALPQAGFWVTHDGALDRIIVEGARLELAPSGEILRAAGEDNLLGGSDPIVGAIAAPAQQGGGFVHWTRTRLFRSSTFTGPIEPILAEGNVLRGVRSGLSGLVVVTDAGPRALLDGGRRLGPLAEPGLVDVVAASPERAIRLDVFGRSAATFDGGRAWLDLTPSVGIAALSVSAEEGELGVETWQGRFVVGPGGKLAPGSAQRRAPAVKLFQIAWKGTRADRDEPSSGYREGPLFQAAVLAGAAVGDGTAYGVAEGHLARVDLATGKLVSVVRDGLERGLECQPFPAGGEVLVACVRSNYQSAGGYLLRSRGGALPVVERAFTDEGAFVADDDGALGYTGSCVATPRLDDPDEASSGNMGAGAVVAPILCVRRAPSLSSASAEWVERTVSLEPSATLVAWIPHRDGTATALVIDSGALPAPAGSARVREQGGVRVVHVDRAPAGFRWKASPSMTSVRDGERPIEQRFHARADGSIDGWLALDEESQLSTVAPAVTIAPDGTTTPHALPPELGSMQVTGAFGAAISRRGELFETLDHGRSWRSAGPSPLPPSAASSGGCAAIGCVLGPMVRLGWGAAAGLTVSVASEPSPLSIAAPSLPRLTCVPRGSPIPEVPPAPLPASSKQTIPTLWGDAIELAREQAKPEVAPSPIAPPASARPRPPRAGALADKRTHTLLFRPPLLPFAAPRRLDVVAPGLVTQRRSLVTPLLGAAGEIALLLGGDAVELRIEGGRATATPAFEPQRYGKSSDALGGAGLALGGDRTLLLGDSRRRLTLEEHSASPPPPLFLGADREGSRRRPMTLGRRDDGAAGVLVFDGAAPETVGVAPLDRAGGGLLALVKLAPWSTVTRAGDPRCKAPDPTAYRALVYLDPSAWLALDPRSLPGVTLGPKALAEVRWGRDRVCLVALDASVNDTRRRGDGARTLRLVVRWDGKGADPGGVDRAPNGALRAADLRQDLQCSLAPAEVTR